MSPFFKVTLYIRCYHVTIPYTIVGNFLDDSACLVVVYLAECLVCGLIVLLPLASPPQWCWQRDTINISNVVYQPSVNSNYHRQTPPSTQNILHTESCAAATASKCVCYNLL